MTLITGISYLDQFVIVAHDSRVIFQQYNAETLDPIEGEYEVVDMIDDRKVIPLTTKVLISTGGHRELGIFVKKELKKRLGVNNDLEECADTLEKLIADLKNDSALDCLQFLKKGTGFTCNLFGFFNDGLTGIADYNSLTEKVDLMESSKNAKGYPVIIQSLDPEKDRKDFYKYLSLAEEERTLANFSERVLMVHAYLSSLYEGISSDCHIHVLYNDQGMPRYKKFTSETKDYYEQLGIFVT